MNREKSFKIVGVSIVAIVLIAAGSLLFSHLRSRGRDVALGKAVAFQDNDEVVDLINAGANVNFHDNADFDSTPLHNAAANGDDPLVQLLLKHGAQIDATNKFISTPLSYAANRGHVSTVKLLLSNGANPLLRNTFGRTPLQEAQGPLRFLHHISPSERASYTQTAAVLQQAEAKTTATP